MSGSNPRGNGTPTICASCDKAFRLINVLPFGADVDYCPTCFETYLNR